MKKLTGVFPALPTPFTAEGKINAKSLEALVKRNITKGVDGFYVCGSTGESLLLSTEERKYVLEIVADTVGGAKPLICHIGCLSTADSIELAKHAENKVAAVSSIPPIYFKYSYDEIKGYYFDLADSVDTGMILYNIPVLTGISFNDDNLADFFVDERFVGLKHTSSDFFSMERARARFPNITIFNGYDELFLAGLSMGADGGIGSTYNVMPEKFVAMASLMRQGELEQAKLIQRDVNSVIKEFVKIGVIPALKACLSLMGIDAGDARKPFQKVSNEQIEALVKNVLPLLEY